MLNVRKLLQFQRPNFKQMGQKTLVIWMIYQAIKGILTTSLIWIPLLWHFWHK